MPANNLKQSQSAPSAVQIHRGLIGIAFDRTAISEVDPAAGRLIFRGENIDAIVATADFSAVAASLVAIAGVGAPEVERQLFRGAALAIAGRSRR